MAFTAYEKSDMLMLKMHCTELRLNQSLVYWNITAISILVKFTALKLVTHFISELFILGPQSWFSFTKLVLGFVHLPISIKSKKNIYFHVHSTPINST